MMMATTMGYEGGASGWKNVETGHSYELQDKGGRNQSMTGRYTRKVVPLEVRGISRGSIESHPLPDQNDDEIGSVPHYFLDSVKEALRSHSHVTPGVSGRSSPTEGAQESHSGWTTGNTTERSSLYSSYEWEDDEFDRQNSRRVRRLFEEIDSMLFEESREPEHLTNLYKECQEWVASFPHFRILGAQVFPPTDMGFQLIPVEATRPSTGSMLVDVTEQDMSLSQECNGLSISGKSVSVMTPRIDRKKAAMTTDEEARSNPFAFVEEEVFAQDGYYEDVVAVDYKSEEDAIFRRHYHPRVTKKGFPPLTPNACLRDSVSSMTFDIAWSEIVSWMRDILRMFRDRVVIDDPKGYDEHVDMIPNLSSTRISAIDPLPVRELSFSRIIDRPMPIRLSTAQPSFDGTRTLAGVLTISTKALQSREKSNLNDEPSTSRDVVMRPGSSLNRFVRPTSVKVQENRLSSARKGAQRVPVRLAPIDRAKTPSVEDDKKKIEIVRGHRLQLQDHMFAERSQLPNDRLSSPGYMFRNGALPPIGLVETPDNPPPSQRGPRKAHFSNRASSAVADKDSRVPIRDRERYYQVPLDNRPSTTHTFRSDTPFANQIARRSSTPMGFNNMRGPNMHNIGHNMLLGITGNSIGNPHLDPNVPQLDEEDDENFENMSHSQWVPSQTPNNPYRRGRQLSQVVR
ncbi:protein FAM149B1-like isoform X2 [Lineus longissimus]|uniref:protein FAM149B1-like isoform X2 n=1 Tax=Lineus longissimus TaxID=88925 RepID=UPI002B4C99BB